MLRGALILGMAAGLAACSTSKPEARIAPEVARGQAYYVTCQGCHGNAGEGLAGMKAPRLAGLPADYVAEQLDLYRRDVRGGPTDFQGVQMNGRAKALPSDQAVKDVAAYVATLPAPVAVMATRARAIANSVRRRWPERTPPISPASSTISEREFADARATSVASR